MKPASTSRKRLKLRLTSKLPLIQGDNTRILSKHAEFKRVDSPPEAPNTDGVFTKIFRQMAVVKENPALADVVVTPANEETKRYSESAPLMSSLLADLKTLPGYSQAGVDEQSCQQEAFRIISRAIQLRESGATSGNVFYVTPVAKAHAHSLNISPLPFATKFDKIDKIERNLLNKLICYSTPSSEHLLFAREALWAFDSTRLPGQLNHIVVDERGPIIFRLGKDATSLEFAWADGTWAQVPLVVPWIKPHLVMPPSANPIEADGVLYEPLISEKLVNDALVQYYSLRKETAGRIPRWTAVSYADRVAPTFSRAFQMTALKNRHTARWQGLGDNRAVAELALNPSLCEIFPHITTDEILKIEMVCNDLFKKSADLGSVEVPSSASELEKTAPPSNRATTAAATAASIHPESPKQTSISKLLQSIQKQIPKEQTPPATQHTAAHEAPPAQSGLPAEPTSDLQMPHHVLLVDYNERLHKLQALPMESQHSLSRVGETAASVIIDLLALSIAPPAASTPDTSFKKAVDFLNHRRRPLTKLHQKISAELLLLGDIVAIENSLPDAFAFVQRHVLFSLAEKDWDHSAGTASALTNTFADFASRFCEPLRRSANPAHVGRLSRALGLSFSEPEIIAFRLSQIPYVDTSLAAIGRRLFDLVERVQAASTSRYRPGGAMKADAFASAASSIVFGAKTPENMNRIFSALTLLCITEDWSKLVACLSKVLEKMPQVGSQLPMHNQTDEIHPKADSTADVTTQTEEQRSYDVVLRALSKLQAELEAIKSTS